uniref:Uncharacterized protein n=1 Tax=Parascaris equorum TaxID=6256 RepID=A0A914RKA1_PAREQ
MWSNESVVQTAKKITQPAASLDDALGGLLHGIGLKLCGVRFAADSFALCASGTIRNSSAADLQLPQPVLSAMLW